MGSFERSVRQGAAGENFFEKYGKYLVKGAFFNGLTLRNQRHIEGMDLGGYVIRSVGEPRPIDTEENVPEGVYPEGATTERSVHIDPAFIEVKTIMNGSFLTRNNNRDEISGTVEFELWSQPDRRNLGWLYAMAYPQKYVGIAKRSVAYPTMLAYLYCADGQGEKPFVSVVFEDYAELERRLRTICPEIWPVPGEPWCVDAVSWEKQESMIPQKGENMWHVPLRLLEDLATVTMIDADPEFSEGRCAARKEVQKARLEYLKTLANGRHLNTRVD